MVPASLLSPAIMPIKPFGTASTARSRFSVPVSILQGTPSTIRPAYPASATASDTRLPRYTAANAWKLAVGGIATGDQAIFGRREAFHGFPEIPLMEDVAFRRGRKRRERPVCLHARVTTSGRRWESRGVLRTVALMWALRLLFYLGAPAHVLARMYQ